MVCMYCGRTSINYEMFVVRKAVKPKGQQYRWQRVGLCCDECARNGKPTAIEYAPPPQS